MALARRSTLLESAATDADFKTLLYKSLKADAYKFVAMFWRA
jgi:hypothetical protein